MHPKTLNKAQQRWHISEKELLAIVYAIERFGEFIDRVIASWFLAQDQTKCQWIRGQLIPDVPKIAICSDSSSALGMLLRLSCPSGRIEHVTPKITRFMTYVDTCACTLFWPLARMLIPGAGDGPCNSLCDYMCRIVGALKRLQDTQVNEDEFFEDMPFDHVLAMSIGDYVELEEHCNQVIYGEHWDLICFVMNSETVSMLYQLTLLLTHHILTYLMGTNLKLFH